MPTVPTSNVDSLSPVDADLLYATCSASGQLLYRDRAWRTLFGDDDDDPWGPLSKQDRRIVEGCINDAATGLLVTHQLVSLDISGRGEPLPVLLNFLPVHTQQTERKRPVDLICIDGEVLAEPASWTQNQTQRNRFETLGRMTMGIAHDFNNLLSGILGYTELLKSAAGVAPPPTLRTGSTLFEHLCTVEKAALDGAALVSKIQQYIRQEKETRFEPVDLCDIVRDSVSLTRPYWYNEPRRQGIDIRTHLDLDDVPAVMGSPTELREVFVNLILNAVQAMPRGGSIRFRLQADDVSGVTVSVGDTGTGIRDDMIEKVFEPLFTTKGERGTGMGLAVTHGIVQEHEGTIAVESVWGEGTTFTLTFPPADEAMPAARQAASEQPSEHARVLIVDDEHMVRSVLEKLLTLKGHTVQPAASGAEALDLLEDNRYDIVFTDHGMPHMNGDEFARRVRALYPGLPLVLLTGDTEVESAGEVVDRVLGKPFKIDELQRTIRELLDE